MFVNNDIRKEMYKGADANVDAQFKKLFIYHMENVSILFADIKVSIFSSVFVQSKERNLFYLCSETCLTCNEFNRTSKVKMSIVIPYIPTYTFSIPPK